MTQKFLKEDGTIEEGILLSDDDAVRMERLESVLHASVCNGHYHASYEHGIRKCRAIAMRVVSGTATLEGALEKEFCPQIEDIPEESVPTVQQPVAAVEKSDLPF